MKKILLAILLASQSVFAAGWFEAGVSRFMDQGQIGPTIAVGLYEPLFLGLAYESWNGIGVNVRENVWATSKHDLSLELNDSVTVCAGVALRHNDVNYSDVHAAVRFALWK